METEEEMNRRIFNELILAEEAQFNTPIRPLESLSLEELFGSALGTQMTLDVLRLKEAQGVGSKVSKEIYRDNVIPFPTKLKSARKHNGVNLAISPYSDVIPMCTYISEVPL